MPATTTDPRPRDPQGRFDGRTGDTTADDMKLAYGAKPSAAQRVVSKLKVQKMSKSTAPEVAEFSAENALVGAQVDRDKRVIRGVSVITSGVTAIGHDLGVDDMTLRQMCDCANRKGRVPTKENHKTGVGETCGYLTNFRIEGAKLLADWHLLKSYPRTEQFLEMAETIPTGCGLSASFTMPERESFGADGKRVARCDDLISVDFVHRPAANPGGLFSAKHKSNPIDTQETDMSDTNKNDKAEILAAIEGLGKQFTALESRMTAFESQAAEPTTEEVLADLNGLLALPDEKLSELGFTRAEIEEAVAELTGEGEGEDDGSDAGADDKGKAELSATNKRLAQLEANEKRRVRQAELAAAEAEMVELAGTIDGLVELNEQKDAKIVELTAKVEALESTLKKHGHKPVQFSAEGGQGGRTPSKFLELAAAEVEKAKSAGKTITNFEAQDIVRKANPAVFEDYRKEIGVSK